MKQSTADMTCSNNKLHAGGSLSLALSFSRGEQQIKVALRQAQVAKYELQLRQRDSVEIEGREGELVGYCISLR